MFALFAEKPSVSWTFLTINANGLYLKRWRIIDENISDDSGRRQ